jgi:hypothetical protein
MSQRRIVAGRGAAVRMAMGGVVNVIESPHL